MSLKTRDVLADIWTISHLYKCTLLLLTHWCYWDSLCVCCSGGRWLSFGCSSGVQLAAPAQDAAAFWGRPGNRTPERKVGFGWKLESTESNKSEDFVHRSPVGAESAGGRDKQKIQQTHVHFVFLWWWCSGTICQLFTFGNPRSQREALQIHTYLNKHTQLVHHSFLTFYSQSW